MTQKKSARNNAGRKGRAGTKQARPFNQTARRIINVSRATLMERGYAQFSMRNVAARARMALNNVQYYFPTRTDLVRALMLDTEERYLKAYEQCLADVGEDREEQFQAILRFNLREAAVPDNRRFFIQMWALLDTMDDSASDMVAEFYKLDLGAIYSQLRALAPSVSARSLRRRATILAALTEGLLVVLGAHSTSPAEVKHLLALAQEVGERIARGEREARVTDKAGQHRLRRARSQKSRIKRAVETNA